MGIGFSYLRNVFKRMIIRQKKIHGNVDIKNKVWDLPIMPKIKHFIWCILSKTIGTATRENSRGIKIDHKCQRCCVDDESINHLLFICPFSFQTWRLSHLSYLHQFYPSNNLEENLKNFLSIQAENELTLAQKILPFWIMWRIWKSRND